MDHGSMDHSQMGHGTMDHSQMNHGTMDRSQMDHSQMDHSQMNHGDTNAMDHGKMDHGAMKHGGMDMDMKMYFHAGIMETILFKGWMTHSVGELVGSCICLFVVALLYEGLKVFREELLCKAHLAQQMENAPQTLATNDETGENGNGTRSDQVIIRSGPSAKSLMCNKWHIIQTFLHIFQVTVSYMLMLVFMTYNVWLCLAVVLGAGSGYFLFGWRKQTTLDVNEHCH